MRMNTSPEPESYESRAGWAGEEASQPPGWIDNLATLVASRVELIQIEARDSARHTAAKAIRVVAAALCVLFAWLLLVAGGIGAIAALAGWPWHWLAIGAAVFHMIAAIALMSQNKTSPKSSFPLTRAEFQKDRIWLESLKNKNGSTR